MAFMNDIYSVISNPPINLTDTTIVEYFITMTTDDRVRGYVERYFARPTVYSTGYITEISQTDYNRLKANSLFNVVSLNWMVSGPIDDTVVMVPNAGPVTRYGAKSANLLAIGTAEASMPGIKDKLRNPLQFYKL